MEYFKNIYIYPRIYYTDNITYLVILLINKNLWRKIKNTRD